VNLNLNPVDFQLFYRFGLDLDLKILLNRFWIGFGNYLVQDFFATFGSVQAHNQRWATAALLIASLPLPLFVKFNSGATAAVPE